MGSTGRGVGVVWWPPLDALCRPGEGLVDIIEAEPEAFWVPAAGGFRSALPQALAHLPQPKLLHGVGAPLGGLWPPPAGHDRALAGDIAALHPLQVSEHLNLTRFRPTREAEPIFAGFMLPPCQSAAGVALAAANIRRYRAPLGDIAVAVETPVNYLPPLPGEIPDGAFVAAVAEAADCGILLDLHNALCNARNGRQSVAAFIAALPLDRVVEIHVAGGEPVAGFWVDSHAGLAEPELLDIAAEWVPRLPNLRAITLEILPDRIAKTGLAAIAAQLGALQQIWACRATSCVATPPCGECGEVAEVDPADWARLLGTAVTGRAAPAEGWPEALWRSCAPAVELYRALIGDARASAVAAAAPAVTRLLLRQRGGAATRLLLADFWRQSPQSYTMADEARAFLRFLAAAEPALPGREAATAQDLAVLSAS